MGQIGSNGKKSRYKQSYYNHPVCVNCSKKIGKIVRLFVKRNGIFIPYGQDSAQAGDLLSCPICHIEIVQGFSDILKNPTSFHVLESEHSVLNGVLESS